MPNVFMPWNGNEGLYKDGLMDQETFLNDKAAWDGKIDANTVGSYYHWGQTAYTHLDLIEQSAGMTADISVLISTIRRRIGEMKLRSVPFRVPFDHGYTVHVEEMIHPTRVLSAPGRNFILLDMDRCPDQKGLHHLVSDG